MDYLVTPMHFISLLVFMSLLQSVDGSYFFRRCVIGRLNPRRLLPPSLVCTAIVYDTHVHSTSPSRTYFVHTGLVASGPSPFNYLENESFEVQQAPKPQPVNGKSDEVEKLAALCAEGAKIRFEDIVDPGLGGHHYELLKHIANGNERKVYIGTPISDKAKEMVNASGKNQAPRTDSQPLVAIKILNLTPDRRLRISNEIKIMRLYKHRHPNLVNLVSAHLNKEENTVWIVTRWVKGAILKGIVDGHAAEGRKEKVCTPAFNEEGVRKLAATLFDSLQTLHSLGCSHGDIHPGNVLVNGETPVLIDCGDGTFENEGRRNDVLMLTYLLVECCVKPVMNTKHIGSIPWEDYDDDRLTGMRKVLEEVARGKFEMPEGMRTFVKDVIGVFREDITANDSIIKYHSFLNNYERVKN